VLAERFLCISGRIGKSRNPMQYFTQAALIELAITVS
jgi:hypothetical protein